MLVVTFLALIVFWKRTPQWCWVVFATLSQCIAMILPILIPVVGYDIVLLSFCSGLIGASGAIYASMLSGYTSQLFRKEPSSAFALLKSLDSVSMGATALIIHFTSFYVAAGYVMFGALGCFVTTLWIQRSFFSNIAPQKRELCSCCNKNVDVEISCEFNGLRLHPECLPTFRKNNIYCVACKGYLDSSVVNLNGDLVHANCLAAHRKALQHKELELSFI
jgi:hypothetical protein